MEYYDRKERNTEYFVIDRIEDGRIAVLEREDRTHFSLLLEELCPNVKEGDVLYQKNGSFWLDRDETERRREAAAQRSRRLFEGK